MVLNCSGNCVAPLEMLVLDEPVQIETLKLVDCVRKRFKYFQKRMEAIVNTFFN